MHKRLGLRYVYVFVLPLSLLLAPQMGNALKVQHLNYGNVMCTAAVRGFAKPHTPSPVLGPSPMLQVVTHTGLCFLRGRNLHL
jgi:hypothetical protein